VRAEVKGVVTGATQQEGGQVYGSGSVGVSEGEASLPLVDFLAPEAGS